MQLQPWHSNPALFDTLSASIKAYPSALIHRDFLPSSGGTSSTMRAVASEQGWHCLLFDQVLYSWDRHHRTLQRLVRQPADIALGEALQAGSCWAIEATLQGRFPIHASAVDLPEGKGTWLIVARSGHGKTSTAASMVLADSRLRSDDVVTLVQHNHEWHCEAGSLTLRMRMPINANGKLPSHIRALPDLSGDGRSLYACATDIPLVASVRGICFVVLDEQAAQVSVHPVKRLEGFMALANDPRTAGVQARDYHMQRVDFLSRLCQSLPLLELRLPFKERDLHQQGHAILACLQQHEHGHSSP